jgi:hypothetical protein
MLPLSGPQPTTALGHYTICCKSQSHAPEDGQKVARNMFLPKITQVLRKCVQKLYSRTGYRLQYGADACYAV